MFDPPAFYKIYFVPNDQLEYQCELLTKSDEILIGFPFIQNTDWLSGFLLRTNLVWLAFFPKLINILSSLRSERISPLPAPACTCLGLFSSRQRSSTSAAQHRRAKSWAWLGLVWAWTVRASWTDILTTETSDTTVRRSYRHNVLQSYSLTPIQASLGNNLQRTIYCISRKYYVTPLSCRLAAVRLSGV